MNIISLSLALLVSPNTVFIIWRHYAILSEPISLIYRKHNIFLFNCRGGVGKISRHFKVRKNGQIRPVPSYISTVYTTIYEIVNIEDYTHPVMNMNLFFRREVTTFVVRGKIIQWGSICTLCLLHSKIIIRRSNIDDKLNDGIKYY